MTSRLYPATRRLFGQVFRILLALVRHVALSLLTFIVLQRLRWVPKEILGEVKERLQLEVFTAGSPPPAPHKGKVALNQRTA